MKRYYLYSILYALYFLISIFIIKIEIINAEYWIKSKLLVVFHYYTGYKNCKKIFFNNNNNEILHKFITHAFTQLIKNRKSLTQEQNLLYS